MKPHLLLAGLVLPLSLFSSLFAAEKPSLLMANAAEVRRDQVIAQIQAKVDQGAASVANFAPELKQLDAHTRLYAEYPELAAEFVLVKAGLYLDALGDQVTGRKLLQEVIRDYAGTPAATTAAQAIDLLERTKQQAAADAELLPVAQAITEKAKAGSHDEAAFKAELAQLDALRTKYAANREAAANLALAKAMFYLRVTHNPAEGRKHLQAIADGYRDTLAGANAQEALGQLADTTKQ